MDWNAAAGQAKQVIGFGGGVTLAGAPPQIERAGATLGGAISEADQINARIGLCLDRLRKIADVLNGAQGELANGDAPKPQRPSLIEQLADRQSYSQQILSAVINQIDRIESRF